MIPHEEIFLNAYLFKCTFTRLLVFLEHLLKNLYAPRGAFLEITNDLVCFGTVQKDIFFR